jgi:hypothetical protein
MWTRAVTLWEHQSNRDWHGRALCFARLAFCFLVGQLISIQKLITISLLDLKLWKILEGKEGNFIKSGSEMLKISI